MGSVNQNDLENSFIYLNTQLNCSDISVYYELCDANSFICKPSVKGEFEKCTSLFK